MSLIVDILVWIAGIIGFIIGAALTVVGIILAACLDMLPGITATLIGGYILLKIYGFA